jgi:hypothetical protein
MRGRLNRDSGCSIPSALRRPQKRSASESRRRCSPALTRTSNAARLVARHLTLGHLPRARIATLGRALLREDAGFHAYQMLEAGVRQFGEWGNSSEGRHILIAVVRYLAAHSPTERAALQTADICPPAHTRWGASS